MSKIIFFGNQKLVQGIKSPVTTITDTLTATGHEIISTIETKEDLTKIPQLLEQNPNTKAVLASFGFIVPQSIIDLFEPLGILNIHPSLLPKYRGSTPIESAILSGDAETGVSIMKIAQQMDAGPIYLQKTLPISPEDDKFTLATKLTELGAQAILQVLAQKLTPTPQSGTPTFTEKLDKKMSPLDPTRKTAEQLNREVRAFLSFPKSKYNFYNTSCTILKTHVSKLQQSPLDLLCADNNYLCIDQLLPENSKPMTPQAFLNGIKNKR